MKKIEQAVVLCAGKGRRMGPAFRDTQKCTLKIDGIPLIVRSVNNLLLAGIKEIILLTGHKARQVEDCFTETSYKKRLRCIFCGDPYQRPLNTLSTIAHAEPYIQNPFLCIHGDILFDYSVIADIQKAFTSFSPLMLISVSYKKLKAPTHTRVQYNDSLVVEDVKSPKISNDDVWMGIDLCVPSIINKYCFNPRLSCQGDLAKAVLSEEQEIRVIQYMQNWIHITTTEDLLAYNIAFRKMGGKMDGN